MQFILGALTGFGIAAFSMLFVFFLFLVCKAIFLLLLSPTVSFEVLKLKPEFFYPLFQLMALDILFGLLAFGCFRLYYKYFKKNEDN